MNPCSFVLGLLPRLNWWWLALAGAGMVWAGHLVDVRRHERRAYAAGQAEVQGRWDATERIRAGIAAKAEADARAEEQRRAAAMRENADETQRLATRDRAAALTVDRIAVGLRSDVAAVISRGGRPAGDSSAADVRPPGAATGILLADVLGPAEQRLRELAREADDARRAGEACERAYDALTASQ